MHKNCLTSSSLVQKVLSFHKMFQNILVSTLSDILCLKSTFEAKMIVMLCD